jgi:DNA-binding transcriptional ArsR family regulator
LTEEGWQRTRSAVSQHLKTLLTAELVSCQAKGSSNLYRLRPETLHRVRDSGRTAAGVEKKE